MPAQTSVAQAIPESVREDVQRAVQVLLGAGCTEVLLFGSAASGRGSRESDIDLAVRGCPPGRFFALLGRLLVLLDHPVDLVDLDRQRTLGAFLEARGELVRVG